MRRLRIFTIAVALFSLTFIPNSQAGVTVTETFCINWDSGGLTGTTSYGSFEYNSTLLANVGQETVGPVGGGIADHAGLLAFQVTVDGTTYTLEGAVDYPDFPYVYFDGGVFDGFSFDAGVPGGLQIGGLTAVVGVEPTSFGTVSLCVVPEPTTALMVGMGLSLFGFMRRRR